MLIENPNSLENHNSFESAQIQLLAKKTGINLILPKFANQKPSSTIRRNGDLQKVLEIHFA